MNYVRQEEIDGCMVACVAMVAGKIYSEVRAMCAAAYDRGIHEVIADNLLDELGFAVVRRYLHVPRLKTSRAAWPCAPFAPAHIALVHVAAGAHAVVVEPNGAVLDPWKQERTTLAHSDYLKIDQVAGYFPYTEAAV